MEVNYQIESPAPNVAHQTTHLKESATHRPVAKRDSVECNNVIDFRTQLSDRCTTMTGKKCKMRVGERLLQLRQRGEQENDVAQPRKADGQNLHNLRKNQAAWLLCCGKT